MLWSTLGDPAQPNSYTAAQQELIDEVTAEIDAITRQHGGLLTQTGKTRPVTVRESGNTLFLPNKPITAVTALVIERGGSLLTFDVSGTQVKLDGGQAVGYNLLAGSGVPTGLMALSWERYGHVHAFAPGDRVSVTYNCGVTQTPPAVRSAARKLLAQNVFSLMENPSGATEIRNQQNLQRFGTFDVLNTVRDEVTRMLHPFTCVVH